MKGNIRQYRFSGRTRFSVEEFNTDDTGEFSDRSEAVDEFVSNLRQINRLQQQLYAERKEGLIFIFQAMDAAGKDGVIRTVFSTLTPHGVKEYCFKVPSSEELSHDFLWRFWSALPARGNISIFNRSYYEDVLIGKVHKLYESQILPERIDKERMIEDRYSFIKNYEDYLYKTGTRVVKIFLNVSKNEQAKRFISRIDTPRKNWKISAGDMAERAYWDDYMEAFEDMVNNTSTPKSPWYVVPADHKWYARLTVSRIVLETLKEMEPDYPEVDPAQKERFAEFRAGLVESLNGDLNYDAEPESAFTDTGAISGGIVKEEEETKILEKKTKIKESGFNAIRDMIARGYIVKSGSEIMEAIAEAENEPDI